MNLTATRRGARIGAVCLALGLSGQVAPALAGTGSGDQVRTVSYVGSPGERNVVDARALAPDPESDLPSWYGAVKDDGQATPSTGCAAAPPQISYAFDILCPTQGPPNLVGGGGDQDDVLSAFTEAAVHAGTTATLTGGDGNDKLYAYGMTAHLDGGPGDDFLSPDADARQQDGGSTPRGVIAGGPGNDVVTYVSAPGPVTVSLDNRANDGVAGEGDNVHSDVERVIGAVGFGNTLIGNQHANTLGGAGAADKLVGGGGHDSLSGYDGNDILDAIDTGGGDQVACGEGADLVYADAGDSVGRDCEVIFFTPKVKSSWKLARKSVVTLKLSCPADSDPPCLGKLTLKHGAKTIAKKSYRVKPGKSATIHVRLNHKLDQKTKATLFLAPPRSHPVAGKNVTLRP